MRERETEIEREREERGTEGRGTMRKKKEIITEDDTDKTGKEEGIYIPKV